MASSSSDESAKENNGLKKKAEMQMMHCSICKLYLNSTLQANAHFSGKSHRNKAKRLSSEEGERMDSYIPTPVSDNPEHFKCDICQKGFNSSMQLKDHVMGKAHQQATSKIQTESPLVFQNEDFKLNSDNFSSTITSPHTTIMETSTCGTSTLGTSQNAVKQEASDVQQTTEEPAQSVGKNLTNLFKCTKCNITLNSMKQLEQHYKGLRHKIMTGKAQPPPVGGEKWESVRFSKISNAILGTNKDTSTGSGGGVNIREYHCEKCNITVNSKIQLQQHLVSNKHNQTTVPKSSNPKRKHPAQDTGNVRGQGAGPNRELKIRRTTPPVHLSNNFVHSNTYIPAGGGKPVFRLPPAPPVPTTFYPLQNSGLTNWTGNFGFDRNVSIF